MALTADEQTVFFQALANLLYPGLKNKDGGILFGKLTLDILSQMISSVVLINEDAVRADLATIQTQAVAQLAQQIATAQAVVTALQNAEKAISTPVIGPVNQPLPPQPAPSPQPV